jgi:hypothetical protein
VFVAFFISSAPATTIAFPAQSLFLDCFPVRPPLLQALVVYCSQGPETSLKLHASLCGDRTMAIAVDTAVSTASENSAATPIKRLGLSHVNLNGLSPLQPLEPIRTRTLKKYRHIAAVHAKPRTSCLSHDSQTAPSFLGFRNLMVIVLSTSCNC